MSALDKLSPDCRHLLWMALLQSKFASTIFMKEYEAFVYSREPNAKKSFKIKRRVVHQVLIANRMCISFKHENYHFLMECFFVFYPKVAPMNSHSVVCNFTIS